MNSRREFLFHTMALSLGVAAAGGFMGFPEPKQALAAKTGGWAGKEPQPADSSALERDRMSLPAPDVKGGKPLMEALALRRSVRKFKEAELSDQTVSDILWAAFGINRADGKRTIPTTHNKQELIVYVALSTGVWRYLPETNQLEMEAHFNLCGLLGGAPMTLGYAASGVSGPMHVGSAYQNVGLYCASAGLGNVVKESGLNVMKKYVSPPQGYAVLILQAVGMPA